MPESLGQTVAAELRAHLARYDISTADLIARLGVRPDWFYRRLRGDVQMTLQDLERICAALDIPVATLLPDGAHVA